MRVLVAGLLITAYVIGSIPFSFLIVKLMTGADIRQVGSHNVGATNVARSFGKLPGIIALILDAAKGYAAVAVARWVTASEAWPLATSGDASPLHSRAFWITLCAVVAVVGHMFPVWLRFHGGKGVATGASSRGSSRSHRSSARHPFRYFCVFCRTRRSGRSISAS